MGHKTLNDLVELVARLRSEDGCPWDRAQDHQTLRPYLLEEAHEVISAIDAGDSVALSDELGDLLLQVLLHCQIASEAEQFSIVDVMDHLSEKLIRRHPHVFADAPKEMAAIRRTWERVKADEGCVSYALPTMLAARKLASKLGSKGSFEPADFPSIETQEGGKIFAAIASAWGKGIDPELALRKAMVHLSVFANEAAQ